MNFTPEVRRLLAQLADDVLVGLAVVVNRFKAGLAVGEQIDEPEQPVEAPRIEKKVAEPRAARRSFGTISDPPASDNLPYPPHVIGRRLLMAAFAKGFKHEMANGDPVACPYEGANGVARGCANAWDDGRKAAKESKARLSSGSRTGVAS